MIIVPIIFIIFMCFSTTTAITELEMVALQDLYNETGGSYWKLYPELGSPWNFTKNASTGEYLHNPCGSEFTAAWQGVTCSNSSFVFQLDITLFNATGPIPSTVSLLGRMTHLSMMHNHLTGPLPSSLGEMSSLAMLSLESNFFSESIPSSLSHATALEQLWISDNMLTGTIPPGLGKLHLLEFVNLAQNYISGTIPSSLGNLTRLILLGLDYNLLSGTIPFELGQLGRLEILGISNCKVVGCNSP